MQSHRILQINAETTAACAVGMLATRTFLYSLFGLHSALLLDVIAVGFLCYAVALALASKRRPVGRPFMLAFAIVDTLWVVGSVLVLFFLSGQFTPMGRFVVIAVAVVVEVFATLQLRAGLGLGYGLSPHSEA